MSAFDPKRTLAPTSQAPKVLVVKPLSSKTPFDMMLWAIPLLTIPALGASALIIFTAVLPMTGLSTTAVVALIALAVLMPFLCTFGPAQAAHARRAQQRWKAWAWLISPILCLACIVFLTGLLRG
jgi:hypothetical protein